MNESSLHRPKRTSQRARAVAARRVRAAAARLPARLLILCCGVAAALPGRVSAAPDFASLQRLSAGAGLAISAQAVDLGADRTVASLAPRQRLIAASLTKLYTAAAALEQWGPDHVFVTRLDYRGRLSADGLLHGDLVLAGSGDPALIRSDLWKLAQRAAQAGVQRVDGDLIVDQSAFGDLPCGGRDRCTAQEGSSHAYNAPLSAAGVDFGTWCVSVRPAAEAGAAATVAVCPPGPAPVALTGTVRTLAPGDRGKVSVARITRRGADTVRVSGGIPAGAPAERYYVAASSPARVSGDVLRTLLRQAGVQVAGSVRVVSAAIAGAEPLARVEGYTLQHQIAMMLHYSNNYMADTLTLDLAGQGAADDGDAPTLKAASRSLSRFAARINAAAVVEPRPPRAAPVLESGSGLTPANRLCAADLAALLRHVYRASAVFPAYLAGLSVPESAPLRLLDGGGEQWMQAVAVKTGSMNHPVSVLGVAGYYRKPDGGWGAFAVIVNGTAQHPHFPWPDAMRAIQQDVSRLVAASPAATRGP